MVAVSLHPARARKECSSLARVLSCVEPSTLRRAVLEAGPNVLAGLKAAGYRISTSGASERQGIVSRLDVGTSGLMVVCASERGYSVLKRAFKERRVDKTYHTLVQGLPDPLVGTIDAPIARHPGHDYKFAVMDSGKHAVTHYELLEAFRHASLLEISLETGRVSSVAGSAKRNLLLLLPGANVVAIFLEARTIVADPQGQRLGDKLAQTQVVEGAGAKELVKSFQEWLMSLGSGLGRGRGRHHGPALFGSLTAFSKASRSSSNTCSGAICFRHWLSPSHGEVRWL